MWVRRKKGVPLIVESINADSRPTQLYLLGYARNAGVKLVWLDALALHKIFHKALK